MVVAQKAAAKQEARAQQAARAAEARKMAQAAHAHALRRAQQQSLGFLYARITDCGAFWGLLRVSQNL